MVPFLIFAVVTALFFSCLLRRCSCRAGWLRRAWHLEHQEHG